MIHHPVSLYAPSRREYAKQLLWGRVSRHPWRSAVTVRLLGSLAWMGTVLWEPSFTGDGGDPTRSKVLCEQVHPRPPAGREKEPSVKSGGSLRGAESAHQGRSGMFYSGSFPTPYPPDFMSWGSNSLLVVEVYTTLEVYYTGGARDFLGPPPST